MTPVSPVLDLNAYCIDVALALCIPCVSEALQAPEGWNTQEQIGLSAAVIAARIDSDFEVGGGRTNKKMSVF